jgi:transcriptional regulator with XRE-family HTH domain
MIDSDMAPEELRRRRFQLGWSQTRLAAEMGITQRVVFLWESGFQPIPFWVPTLLTVFENYKPMRTAS